MPNLASLLKNEISRLSRREIRKEILPLRRSSAAHRREIAALKRTIAALERRAKSLVKLASSRSEGKAQLPETQTRFVAKGLLSLRKRLGLSASDLARLLGVSMQSVYNWERKKATPRKEQVAAIARLRGIGKKEAHQRLEKDAPSKAIKKTQRRPAKEHATRKRIARAKKATRRTRTRAK